MSFTLISDDDAIDGQSGKTSGSAYTTFDWTTVDVESVSAEIRPLSGGPHELMFQSGSVKVSLLESDKSVQVKVGAASLTSNSQVWDYDNTYTLSINEVAFDGDENVRASGSAAGFSSSTTEGTESNFNGVKVSTGGTMVVDNVSWSDRGFSPVWDGGDKWDYKTVETYPPQVNSTFGNLSDISGSYVFEGESSTDVIPSDKATLTATNSVGAPTKDAWQRPFTWQMKGDGDDITWTPIRNQTGTDDQGDPIYEYKWETNDPVQDDPVQATTVGFSFSCEAKNDGRYIDGYQITESDPGSIGSIGLQYDTTAAEDDDLEIPKIDQVTCSANNGPRA